MCEMCNCDHECEGRDHQHKFLQSLLMVLRGSDAPNCVQHADGRMSDAKAEESVIVMAKTLVLTFAYTNEALLARLGEQRHEVAMREIAERVQAELRQ